MSKDLRICSNDKCEYIVCCKSEDDIYFVGASNELNHNICFASPSINGACIFTDYCSALDAAKVLYIINPKYEYIVARYYSEQQVVCFV